MSEKRLASSGDSFVDLTQMETVDLLNKLSDENTKLHKKVEEQQATIEQLQDLCGKSDGENMKLRIENKRLQEKKEYWESKAMTLLMQVRRLTSRMTDREVEEFKKELEDD